LQNDITDSLRFVSGYNIISFLKLVFQQGFRMCFSW